MIKLNQIAVVLLFVFASGTVFSQSVFDKFDNQDDITSIIVNKKMFALMSKIDAKDKEGQQFMTLIKKLDNLKVYMTTSNKKSDEMKLTADKFVKSAGLEELMRITEKGKNVKIFVKSGGGESQIKELMMFIEGVGQEQSVLLSLTGDFDLDELSVLTDKMNLPGGSDLKKAGKK